MVDIPPPGTYHPQEIDSATGAYILTQNRNQIVRRFVPPQNGAKQAPSNDFSFTRSNTVQGAETPGPGSYTITSELGQIMNQPLAKEGLMVKRQDSRHY